MKYVHSIHLYILIASLVILFIVTTLFQKDTLEELLSSNASNTEDSQIHDTSFSQEENINADSDGDGLKDWKEVLLGFDPLSADSDGDGVLDGDEYKIMQSMSSSLGGDVGTVSGMNGSGVSVQADGVRTRLPDKSAIKIFKQPIIHSVSPSRGPVGTTVIVTGDNFSKENNIVYASYKVFYSVPSEDGKTLSVTLGAPSRGTLSGITMDVDYFLYVRNAGGVSNPIRFVLEWR